MPSFSTYQKLLTNFKQHLVRETNNSVYFKFGSKPSPILLTCEHASNDLPQDCTWSDLEAELSTSHWSYDPGAAAISLELGEKLGCSVVLSKWSRLFIDVNRPVGSDTICRQECDGQKVSFNRGLTTQKKMERMHQHYLPYHLETSQVAEENNATHMVSLHSFTKNYQGEERDVETGVLHSCDRVFSDYIINSLRQGFYKDASEFKLAANAPWSGLDGIMYSVDCLINAKSSSSETTKKRQGSMLEFRNDLLVDGRWRDKMVEALAGCLKSLED